VRPSPARLQYIQLLRPEILRVDRDLKYSRTVGSCYFEPPIPITSQFSVQVAQAFGGKTRGRFPSRLACWQILADVVLMTGRVTVKGVKIIPCHINHMHGRDETFQGGGRSMSGWRLKVNRVCPVIDMGRRIGLPQFRQ
jgi:hypothetical protein